MISAKNKLVRTAALAAALTASSAFAQVRQVQLGNPMDANPGINGGGSNTPVRGYVPINGNEIVTGNVAGLKYFHGSVGTSSPYQFQGNLPSSSLSNFTRQSAGGVAPNGAISQSYYLPSATVSTANGSLYSAPMGSGFDSQLVPRIAVSPIVTGPQVQTIAPLAEGRAYDRGLPSAPLLPGDPGTVLSAPLFALRESNPLTVPESNLEGAGAGRNRNKPTPGGSDNPTNPNQNPGNTPNNANPADTGADSQDNTSANSQRDLRINSQIDNTRSLALQRSPDLRIGTAYSSLLEQFTKVEDTTPAGVDPRSISLATNDRGERNSNGTTDVDPLTGRQRQIMQVPNRAPEGTARGGAGGTTPGGTVVPGRGPIAARTNTDFSLSAKRLQDLPTNQLTAGSKVKPVKTFAPTTPGMATSTVDALLSRGEKTLKEGRYLESALAFQNALAMRPDDPLALVGWAHADIGAGFYSTAANNLKFVYTRKPEMISVHYDPASFIAAARVDYVIKDLQKLTDSKEQANLAYFLTCYLAYQSGRTELLQTELKNWAARPDHDEWQPVVSRAWTTPTSAETKPAQSETK